MINLRGAKVASLSASGSRGFYLEGYRHHKLLRFLPGFSFEGSVPILKTVTTERRMPEKDELGQGKGNIVLDTETWMPTEWFSDCIKIRLFAGEALNAVGLSNPGARAVLQSNRWNHLTESFIASFMALGKTPEERLQEAREFFELLRNRLQFLRNLIGVQINASCPNINHDPKDLVGDMMGQLEVAKQVLSDRIPVGLKINVLTPASVIKEVDDSGLCDFLEIPNTLPYGTKSKAMDWGRFGSESPLKKYGGGGYSGRENFEAAIGRIANFRKDKIRVPIICGGVSCKGDVNLASLAGADAVAFARITMSPFHAWKVQGIIKHAEKVFGGE